MIWEKVKLGEVCHIEKGNIGILKATQGEYPLVVLGEERRTHNEYQFDGEAVVIPLVSSTGHGDRSMKRIHFQSGKFSVGSILCAVMPKDNKTLSAEFLYRYLDLNKERELVSRMKGMANVSLSIKSISEVEIPIPPIEIQREIVIKFDAIETSNHALLSEHNHQHDLLTKLRQQILQDAVQGKLVPQDPNDEPASKLLERIKAEKEKLVREKKIKKEKPLPPIKPEEIPFEIPENWQWCRLGETGDFNRGKSKHRPRNDEKLFVNGSYPLVQTGDVAQSKYHKFLIETYSSSYNDVGLSQSKLWKKGTFCITIAANIAEVGFLNIDACVPDSVVTFYSIPEFRVKYLQYYFQTVKNEITAYAPATAQKNINLGIIQELVFPLPPSREQARIVDKVEALMHICDELEKTIQQNQTYTQELLQVALKEAFEPRL
jgi:type I restriction enzyme S subunit